MPDLAKIIRLSLNESKAIVPIQTLSPGTYTQRMTTQGNSLLSTVFVDSLDVGASVVVRYYDYGVGAPTQFDERVDIAEHDPVVAAGDSSRILVTKIHDKPVAEIEVIGGSVTFGVYVTVVSSTASDLDSALKRDGQDVNLVTDKGIPTMCYDEATGKFYFLRCEGGVLPVSFSEAGDNVHLKQAVTSTPGIVQELIVDTVPVGKTRKLTNAKVIFRSHGYFEITAGGVIIGSGITSPMTPTDIFEWSPRFEAAAGTEIKLRFCAHSSAPDLEVRAYLMGSDI